MPSNFRFNFQKIFKLGIFKFEFENFTVRIGNTIPTSITMPYCVCHSFWKTKRKKEKPPMYANQSVGAYICSNLCAYILDVEVSLFKMMHHTHIILHSL